MKFSIIMPVYNAEKFLEESINSVISQSYEDWELIAIDDGSGDESLPILQKLACDDLRIRFFSQENRGVSATRNRALDLASGEYALFLDSDDTWHKDTLLTVAEAIKASLCDVVIFNMLRTDVHGKVTGKITAPISEKTLEITTDAGKRDYIYSRLCGTVAFGLVGNFAVRRELISDIRFSEDMILCEDLIFDMQMYEKAEKIVSLPDYLYYYRNNPSGAINHFNDQKLNDLKTVYQAKLAMADRYDLPEEVKEKALLFFCGNIVQFYHSFLENSKLCKEYRNKILQDDFIMAEIEKYKALLEQPIKTDILLGNAFNRLWLRQKLLLRRCVKNIIGKLKGKQA